MKPQDAWIIYVFVVVVTLIAVSFTRLPTWSIRFFCALIVGAIIFAFISPGVTEETNDERTWFSLLTFTAIILPILVGVWIFMSGDIYHVVGKCGTNYYWMCDGEGCRLTGQNTVCQGPGTNTTNASIVQ